MSANSKPTNRLIQATSPYLLQHAHNPVDWYPWGAEALERAKVENKPIFLSIGYSACHWCHVMERESFENKEVAEVMNRHFVNIKVDREERPDLDETYMTAVQLMTGSGGWPMSVWLTPDLKPFYGGTYFPPNGQQALGRPGLIDVCQTLAQLWREQGATVTRQAEELTRAMRKMGLEKEAPATTLDRSAIEQAVDQLRRSFDATFGGFGTAPKFPPSMAIFLLLREYLSTGDRHLRTMADVTLHRMAEGGLYDQLGGGFARYSVDECWLVPHFEKMLYDNALLARTYLEAGQLARQEKRPEEAQFYARIAGETLDYVLRDMTLPDGGFASSEDADSEGEEGKFYLWTPEEIQQALGKEAGEQVSAAMGVSAKGNFAEHGVPTGKSILHWPHSIKRTARWLGFDLKGFRKQWPHWQEKLLETRTGRVRPRRDDKVLVAWNALMISALARGYEGLGKAKYLTAAIRAADFILKNMTTSNGRLRRSWRKGVEAAEAEPKAGGAKRAKTPGSAPNAAIATPVFGFLEDYAFFCEALHLLYEATGHLRWLKEAEWLTTLMLTDFYDAERAGFYLTADYHEALPVRGKNVMDGALPSGSSMAVMVLLKLGAILNRPDYFRRAEETLLANLPQAHKNPGAFHFLLGVLDFALTEPVQLAVVGSPSAQGAFLKVIANHFLPHRILYRSAQTDAKTEEMRRFVPLLTDKTPPAKGARVYVCQNQTCHRPADTPDELREQLKALEGPIATLSASRIVC